VTGPLRISPADVGRRVSIRTRIASVAPGEPILTDTVGTLRAWSEGVLEVERRDGTIARLAEADLVAGKTIGDTPVRRRRDP
jgi:N-acetylglutamate synthase